MRSGAEQENVNGDCSHVPLHQYTPCNCHQQGPPQPGYRSEAAIAGLRHEICRCGFNRRRRSRRGRGGRHPGRQAPLQACYPEAQSRAVVRGAPGSAAPSGCCSRFRDSDFPRLDLLGGASSGHLAFPDATGPRDACRSLLGMPEMPWDSPRCSTSQNQWQVSEASAHTFVSQGESSPASFRERTSGRR